MQSDRFLPPKTFAEFFAGIGLMRMGLERAGWIPVFANDIDPDKEKMYRAHFNDDRDMNGGKTETDISGQKPGQDRFAAMTVRGAA